MVAKPHACILSTAGYSIYNGVESLDLFFLIWHIDVL